MQSEPTPPGPDRPAGEQIPIYNRDGSRPRWRDRIVAGALCLVVGAGAGFALGRTTAPSGPSSLAEAFQQAQQGKLPTGDLQGQRGQGGGGGLFGGQNGQSGQGNQQGGPPGGGGIQGDITEISGDVVTISTQAGDLKVKLGTSTAIRKAVSADRGDLAVGDTVSVRINQSGSGGDGTATASSITKELAQ